MLQFLLLTYGLDENTEYYIQSSFNELTTLTLEIGTVRFTPPDVIKERGEKIISIVTLEKDSSAPTFKIKFKGGNYLCKRSANEFGVISCPKNEGLSDWEIIDTINDTYGIRLGAQCLKVVGKDNVRKGYYVHASRCDKKDNEIFKVVKVPSEPKNEPTEAKVIQPEKEQEQIEAKNKLPVVEKEQIEPKAKQPEKEQIEAKNKLPVVEKEQIEPKNIKLENEQTKSTQPRKETTENGDKSKNGHFEGLPVDKHLPSAGGYSKCPYYKEK